MLKKILVRCDGMSRRAPEAWRLRRVLTLAANAPSLVRNAKAATAILAETDVEFLHVSGDLHRTR